MSKSTEPLHRVFVSYRFGDEALVAQLVRELRRQDHIEVYFFIENRKIGTWPEQVQRALDDCETVLIVLGETVGATQESEVRHVLKTKKRFIIVQLTEDLPSFTLPLAPLELSAARVLAKGGGAGFWCGVGRQVWTLLWGSHKAPPPWVEIDGLPIGYPFGYEKDLIKAFDPTSGDIASHRLDLVTLGCPASWPSARVGVPPWYENQIHESVIGSYGDSEARISVDARQSIPSKLSFLEARPRRRLSLPHRGRPGVRVAIVVSGGIAPGINAVLASLIERHRLYSGQDALIRVYHGGFQGLHDGADNFEIVDWTDAKVKELARTAGSCVATARFDELLNSRGVDRIRILDRIIGFLQDIDILYVIGGDGSMRAAHALATRASENTSSCLSVVGIPKTMDNDILWVWQSFGFASAVEMATRFSRQLHQESFSNPRLCVMQLFGSDSGFVVSHAALASGDCDAALIPEVDFNLVQIAKGLIGKLKERKKSQRRPFGLVMMAETAIPRDWNNYVTVARLSAAETMAVQHFDANGRRVIGQTPDELRSAALKLVSFGLQFLIRKEGTHDAYWNSFRVFSNEPRHLIRSMEPSSIDVTFARRLGNLAVDNAMAGYTDFMVSQWLTEYVLVPLELVVLGRKRVPPSGIFWKSVIANTGQESGSTATGTSGARTVGSSYPGESEAEQT